MYRTRLHGCKIWNVARLCVCVLRVVASRGGTTTIEEKSLAVARGSMDTDLEPFDRFPSIDTSIDRSLQGVAG